MIIPLQSLPLGFRFRPTDEELVNHYLKRKINGRIRSEIEVIPEIEVCKWEPWDLPDRALIRSDDLEWFFFSLKDRKYPNGHRSNRANRATEAGYWKATGKDRVIKTKAVASPTVIGMKKTLVFHRGRAPKGIRTNWIMHEYRATEPEFESGEQGGYVLYRLFKKAVEGAPGCNRDEMEISGLCPTPTKSSPSVTQHEADTFEEFGTPMAPSNDVSPVSAIQEDPQSLLKAAVSQPLQFPRWSADKADHSSKGPEDVCNRHLAIEQEAAAGAVVDPLLDALGQFNDPKDEQIYSNGFPSINSPMRLYSNHPFFGSTDKESHVGFYQSDYPEHDPMNELLNSIISNPDDYPDAAMVPRSEAIHSRSSSEVDTEVGFTQGCIDHYDPGWFNMEASGDYLEFNALCENSSLLPCDSAALDVCSLDSGAESLQDLLNIIEESNSYNNSFSNGVGVEETGNTGIKIRPRQPQQPALDNLSAQQGFARRRIRLQMQVREVSSIEREMSCKKEDDEGREATVVDVEVNKKHEEAANVETISVSTSLIKREVLPIHDDTGVFSNVEESKPKLRLRTKTSEEAVTTYDKLKDPDRRIKTSRPAVATGYVIFFAIIIMILVLLCVGIWRMKRSQSLWISMHPR